MRKITQAEIEELRAKTPSADLEDFTEFVVKDGADAAEAKRLNEDLRAYLRHFAKPKEDGRPCLACGAHMGGFVWGLVHGHGHCRECGWPATLYHFVKDRDGKDLATVRGVLLQVHPDEVSIRESKPSRQPQLTLPEANVAHSGVSWNGYNVYGDEKSIAEVRRLIHLENRLAWFERHHAECADARPGHG